MESISRISSLLETARDLTLEAARDAGPRRSARPLPAQQVKKLLDSRNEKDVLDGLRRVIAMQYATPPQPTLPYFPAVLKTLSNQSPATRPLVYSYLLHHAHSDPDTALLSINTIQKTLSDSNPRVRALALKTMSGIKVPVISQIVSLAIKKGVNDPAPVVRKTAALACVKCIRLDSNTRPQIEDYLTTLLADKQYYVVGAAVQAFREICPDRLDMLHSVYRKLCKMVVDMDEWSQLALIETLITYSRKSFPKQSHKIKKAATQEQRARDFYEDLEPEEQDEAAFDEVDYVDPDLELFLKSIQPLLSSRNSAVVIAVTRAYQHLSPKDYLPQAVGPLIALLRTPQDIRQVAMYNIVQVCLLEPTYFVPYFRHFLIQSTEAPQIWQLKLEVLTLIFPHCHNHVQDLILAELEHFSSGTNHDLIRESVRAIGRCAQSTNQSTSRRCLTLLLKQIHSHDATLVGEAMQVIRHLIQRNPTEHHNTIIRLARNLDTLTSPAARASIVWLVGEYHNPSDPTSSIAPDVLRILLKTYPTEPDAVRAQIILLATKLRLHELNAANKATLTSTTSPSLTSLDDPSQDPSQESSQTTSQEPSQISLLYTHTTHLTHYTPSFALRDRARTFKSLLLNPTSTELATLLLLAQKPVPQAPSPSEMRKAYGIGSVSLVLGERVRGYAEVPPWVGQGMEVDARVREDGAGRGEDESGERGVGSAAGRLEEAVKGLEGEGVGGGRKVGRGIGGGGAGGKSLDDWLDEEDESEEDEKEDESEEDEKEDDSDDEDEESEESSEEEESGKESGEEESD